MKILNTNIRRFFRNFDDLVSDIKIHISRNNSAKIIQNDNPRQLTLGYKDEISGKEWHITYLNLKRWVSKFKVPEKFSIQRKFMTKENKENLIKSFYT